MIIYTSGSTGQPKGAMHNFARISTVGHGIAKRIDDSLGHDRDHRMLSYLPLAHVFERAWAETVALVHGRIHMYFAESLDTFIKDLNRAQPTIFVSVPRLWLKFQQGVFAKMPAKKLNLLAVPALHRQGCGQESADRFGLGQSGDGGQRLSALAARFDSLVPPPGLEFGRGLRHDRGLCLFAQL
jgi:long-chain acyl-CoA synthetase